MNGIFSFFHENSKIISDTFARLQDLSHTLQDKLRNLSRELFIRSHDTIDIAGHFGSIIIYTTVIKETKCLEYSIRKRDSVCIASSN